MIVSEPIRDPENIELPDEAEEVLGKLLPDGREQFIAEIIGAVRAAKNLRDFRPVQDVIDAWYRTMLFVQSTSPEEEAELQDNVDEILEEIAAGDHGQTYDELREELGLPAPTRRSA